MNQTLAQAIDAEEARLTGELRLNPTYRRLIVVREARYVLKDTDPVPDVPVGERLLCNEVEPREAWGMRRGPIPGPEQIDRPPASLCTVRVTSEMTHAGADVLQSADQSALDQEIAARVFWAMINAIPDGPLLWADLWVAAGNDLGTRMSDWNGESNGRRS